MKRKYKPIDEVQEKLKDGVYNLAKVTIQYIQMSSKSEEEKKNDLKKIYEMFNSIPEELKSLPLRYGLEFVCNPPELTFRHGLDGKVEGLSVAKVKKPIVRKKDVVEGSIDKQLYSYKEAGKYLGGIHGRTIGKLVSGKRLDETGGMITQNSLIRFLKEIKDYYFLKDRIKYLGKESGLSLPTIKKRMNDYLINFSSGGANSLFVYKKDDEKEILEKLKEKKKEKVSKNPELVTLSKLKEYGLTAEEVQEKLGDPKKIDDINAGWPKDEIEKLAKKTI